MLAAKGIWIRIQWARFTLHVRPVDGIVKVGVAKTAGVGHGASACRKRVCWAGPTGRCGVRVVVRGVEGALVEGGLCLGVLCLVRRHVHISPLPPAACAPASARANDRVREKNIVVKRGLFRIRARQGDHWRPFQPERASRGAPGAQDCRSRVVTPVWGRRQRWLSHFSPSTYVTSRVEDEPCARVYVSESGAVVGDGGGGGVRSRDKPKPNKPKQSLESG